MGSVSLATNVLRLHAISSYVHMPLGALTAVTEFHSRLIIQNEVNQLYYEGLMFGIIL